jgi:hypothetical protein
MDFPEEFVFGLPDMTPKEQPPRKLSGSGTAPILEL